MSKVEAWVATLLALPLEENDECAIWPFSARKGYGTVRSGGKLRSAQHYVWERWHNAPWPDGMLALHGAGEMRCTSTMCVHPLHCTPGTEEENMADRLADGTHSRGEKSGTAKLTEAQVLEIREKHAAGATQTALGALYGVSRPTIGAIVHGKSWWDTAPEERVAEVRHLHPALARNKLLIEPKGADKKASVDYSQYPKLTPEELKEVDRAVSNEMWGDGFEFAPPIIGQYAEWVTTPIEFRELESRKHFAQAYGITIRLLAYIEEHDEFQRLILERHSANGIPRMVINMAMDQLVAQATKTGASDKVITLLLRQAGVLVADKLVTKTEGGVEQMTDEQLQAEADRLAAINAKQPQAGLVIDLPALNV